MKSINELEHMKFYNRNVDLVVPYNPKDKKKGTAVQILTGNEEAGAEYIIGYLKNPNIINGYYTEKGITNLISVSEQTMEESVAVAVGSGVAAAIARDIAIKYTAKWIDAKEAKTPTQKQTAAKVFMAEYKRGLKAYEKHKRNPERTLKGVSPDAWWIVWFGISMEDIKKIGTNDYNRVSKHAFDNFISRAMNNHLTEKEVNAFKLFIKDKEFFKISYAVEDTGKVPWKVDYLYCPQTGKIYQSSPMVSLLTLNYKHPLTVTDYLNRSRKSMLEIQDVLEICEDNLKAKKK